MNLKDIINPNYGLQQDKWTSHLRVFGNKSQLTVVGFSSDPKLPAKYYIVHCKSCAKDSELFGEGYFKMSKAAIGSGSLPCGCSRNTQWTKEQYSILVTRAAESRNYVFNGFIGDWLGARTRLSITCELHGIWETSRAGDFVNKGTRCRQCAFAKRSNAHKFKPDSEMISSFMDSGAYHPDTRFWRSQRESTQGVKKFWFVECPICRTVRESPCGALQQGVLSCFCSKHRQTEAYINIVTDCGTVLGLKFGICVHGRSKLRCQQQGRESIYNIEQHSVYRFPSIEQCKTSERECKRQLECKVFTREELADGHTETTWVYNLDKIIAIYKANGGVRVDGTG